MNSVEPMAKALMAKANKVQVGQFVFSFISTLQSQFVLQFAIIRVVVKKTITHCFVS
jgi:hypothetical protein